MTVIRRSDAVDWRVPKSVDRELEDAAARARQAGAPEVLDLIGVGMFGIIFCDEKGHAWKVGRLEKPTSDRAFIREAFQEEYEWLRDAARSSIAAHVAKAYGYHPEPVVIERECVAGVPGGWSDSRELNDLHRKIEAAMLPFGWTAPEYKEDSYIIKRGGDAVLVDASMPHRIGDNLRMYVEDVLEHRRVTKDRWHDLAFYILREMHEKTIARQDGIALLDRLTALDPQIRHSFSW